jgi:hypothetical protein
VRYTPADWVWLAAFSAAGVTSPLGRGLPRHSGHDPGLAPPARLTPGLRSSHVGRVVDDRRMLLLSILYRLLRGLLGLIAVLVRRHLWARTPTAGLTARKCRVAPPDFPGPLHARRPGMAGRLSPAPTYVQVLDELRHTAGHVMDRYATDEGACQQPAKSGGSGGSLVKTPSVRTLSPFKTLLIGSTGGW